MSYERMTKAEPELKAEIAGRRARAGRSLEQSEATDAVDDEPFGPDSRRRQLPRLRGQSVG